jgi:RNA polymerase sigma factor (sigma-70 family)
MAHENARTATVEDLLAHASWARRLARGLVQDDAAAEDLVQDALARGVEGKGPREPGSVRGWLHRVLTNRARESARSESRRRAREEVAPGAVGEALSPDDAVARLELHRNLAQEVASLDDPFRRTLILHYYEGISLAEIARMEHIPPPTSRWRLQRALELLRGRLDAKHGGKRSAWTSALVAFAGEEAFAAASSISLTPLLVGGTAVVAGLGFAVTVVLSSGNAPELEPTTVVAVVDQDQHPQPPDPDPVTTSVPDPAPVPEPARVPRQAPKDFDATTLQALRQLGYIAYFEEGDAPAIDPSATSTPPPGMVLIPGGAFPLGVTGADLGLFTEAMLGEGRTPKDLMRRSVISGAARSTPVEPFFIDIHEVTNARYLVYVTETGAVPPSNWENGEIPRGTENHPVSFVTFDDASAYARWAGKRLPTEIEWEKAARGHDGRWFPWGNVWAAGCCKNAMEAPAGKTAVGSFPKGQSPYGVMDLAGNVWEWTSTYIAPYPGNDNDSEFNRARGYVIRGGSFMNSTYELASFLRNSAEGQHSFEAVGFRCVKDVGK